MTRLSDLFPSKYLKTEDLRGEHRLTIRDIAIEEVGQNDHKPVMYFTNAKKGLVLNRTKIDAIKQGYGNLDIEALSGKDIILAPGTTLFKGQSTACINVRVPVGSIHETKVTPTDANPFSDDEVPEGGMDDGLPPF